MMSPLECNSRASESERLARPSDAAMGHVMQKAAGPWCEIGRTVPASATEPAEALNHLKRRAKLWLGACSRVISDPNDAHADARLFYLIRHVALQSGALRNGMTLPPQLEKVSRCAEEWLAAKPGTTPALRKIALLSFASSLRGLIAELERIEAVPAPAPACRERP